jgi:hypothetical protein
MRLLSNWVIRKGLAKGTPVFREAEENSDPALKVVSTPRLGGLHHRYDLAA